MTDDKLKELIREKKTDDAIRVELERAWEGKNKT